MNNTKRSISLFLFLSLVFNADGILAQLGLGALKGLKVGYINSEVLKERLPDFEKAQSQLDELQQTREREIADLQSEVDRLEETLRNQAFLSSDTRRSELEASLGEKKHALQNFSQEIFGPKGELAQEHIKLFTPIYDRINAALQRIGKEQEYDFIFDSTSNLGIVFIGGNKVDITEEVLAHLREEPEKNEEKE